MADGPFLVGMSTSHGHTPAATEAVAQPPGIRPRPHELNPGEATDCDLIAFAHPLPMGHPA
ncbi:hypothetical protein [Streptomyces sp. NPDC051994]|uniref:hypothetical protein n=1 Tax=unclassified Streptomyces TaxID=2593676 RepID=UPI0034157191